MVSRTFHPLWSGVHFPPVFLSELWSRRDAARHPSKLRMPWQSQSDCCWERHLGPSDFTGDRILCLTCCSAQKKVTSLAYATHSICWVLNDQKISRETMSWHCKQLAKVIKSHHTYDSLCFSLPFATRQLKCFARKKHLCLKTIKNLPFAMLFFNLVRLCFSLRGTEEKATKGNSHNKPCSCDGRTCQCQASSYSSWIASTLDGFWTCKKMPWSFKNQWFL